jgi:hypothetical protein
MLDSLTTSWLKSEEYPIWDAFAGRHPLGLIYHLSSWKEAMERAFSHIRGHFIVLRDRSGEIIAGMPVYVVRSWLLGNRIVSIPYASVCDPLIDSAEQYHQMLPALVELQKETVSRSIEIRMLKTASRLTSSSVPSLDQPIHHYLPLSQPPEELRKKFARTAISQMIDRAQKQGLSVKTGRDESAIRSFHSLSIHTRKRLCLPPIPFIFFDSFVKSFSPDQMDILFAVYEKQNIAGLLLLKFNDVLHIEYFAGNHQAYQKGASTLLYWEAIRHAWASGCKIVSFGRTDSWNKGLVNFKRRWATIEEPIAITRISVNSNHAYSGYNSAKNSTVSRLIFGKAPKPLRESLASFIYRHHG